MNANGKTLNHSGRGGTRRSGDTTKSKTKTSPQRAQRKNEGTEKSKARVKKQNLNRKKIPGRGQLAIGNWQNQKQQQEQIPLPLTRDWNDKGFVRDLSLRIEIWFLIFKLPTYLLTNFFMILCHFYK